MSASDSSASSARTVVATDRAPAAIGPYSQAIRCANLVFTSGQIALDPGRGELVEGGIEAETRQVMTNLRAVLEAAGTGLDHVLKTTIYLIDMGHFATVNEIYGESFLAEPPARSTVAVRQLPKGALVEVDAVASIPGEGGAR